MSNTAPSRADPVVVFPLGRWCPPQETSQPHPPQVTSTKSVSCRRKLLQKVMTRKYVSIWDAGHLVHAYSYYDNWYLPSLTYMLLKITTVIIITWTLSEIGRLGYIMGVCSKATDILSWRSLLGLLSWSPIFRPSQCNSFEDQEPIDEIYGFPIFKWAVITWQ